MAADEEISYLAGLALSGGGLRSATFALGAIQALAKRGVLGNFDYLSTVSGGGYAGSFLSCILNSEGAGPPTSGEHRIGLGGDDLPFKRSETQESAPMRHLRSSSKALLTGGFWKRLEIPVLALAGWLASFLVVLPPLVVFTLGICYANQKAISNALQDDKPIYPDGSWEQIVLAATLAVFACCLLAITVKQHFRRKRGKTDLPANAIFCVGIVFLFVLAVLAWWAFPVGARLFVTIESLSEDGLKLPSESVIAGLAALAIPVFSRLTKMTSKKSVLKPILASITFAVLPLMFVWLVATMIASHFLFVGESKILAMDCWWWLLGFVFVVWAVTHLKHQRVLVASILS